MRLLVSDGLLTQPWPSAQESNLRKYMAANLVLPLIATSSLARAYADQCNTSFYKHMFIHFTNMCFYIVTACVCYVHGFVRNVQEKNGELGAFCSLFVTLWIDTVPFFCFIFLELLLPFMMMSCDGCNDVTMPNSQSDLAQ